MSLRLREFYEPCPEHPAAPMRRILQPVSRDGKHFTEYKVACIDCGRLLSPKPTTTNSTR